MHHTRTVIARSIAIGAVAGLRSMTAPAAVILAAEQGWGRRLPRRLSFLRNNKAVAVATLAAAGEWVADKLPSTPKRTAPVGLVARFTTGAITAAILCGRDRKAAVPAALIGGAAAVGAAFLGYQARQGLRRKLGVSDLPIALAEDAVAIGAGLLTARAA